MSNSQRGVIASVWLYLAGAIALCVAIAGLIHVWNGYTDRLDKQGYDRGVAETTGAFQKRDNAQLQAALAAKTAAEDRAAQLEAVAATAQSNATKAYSKGVKDGQAKTATLVAAARAGALQLRDPGNQTGACPTGGGQTGEGQAAGSPSGGDGAQGAVLSGSASQFLLELTGEADEVAKQLAAAQAVIISDRELCNAP